MPCTTARGTWASTSRRRRSTSTSWSHPRTELPPLLNVPTGGDHRLPGRDRPADRLILEATLYLQDCLDRMARPTRPAPARASRTCSDGRGRLPRQEALRCRGRAELRRSAGRSTAGSRTSRLHRAARASCAPFAPRMIHVLPGNSPAGCVKSIAQGAMVKAVNLFKMPSSDPFTCVAILRTMAEIDPDHPVVQSMSAVYWRGGDERSSGALYRPQYFDKIVAWGGGDAINNVIKYLGPGLPAGLVRPQDVDLHGRARGFRLRRDARPWQRTPPPPTSSVLQSGSLRRQPFHLRRGEPGRHRPVLRTPARAHRRRPRSRLGRSHRPLTWTCASRSTMMQ